MANESQSRTARRQQLKNQKKSKKKPIWKKLFLIVGIIILVTGLGVGTVFGYYVATAPDIDSALLSDPASTKIRDMDGEIFADLGTEKRTKITYNDLPDVLIDAVIATEDARFMTHSGIDFRRIGGAIIANVTDGFGSQGASTITQQVVKGSFLSSDKTIKRKVQEQWLAVKIDSDYSKEEIMEMYLNKIFYGANAYGVAKAAEIYFGKTNLQELTLPEAALLAGLPQRPTAYNPFENPDLAKERMNTVLSLMVQHGKITQAEADEAMDVSVESMLVEKRPDSTKYEAFIQQIADEVEEKTGANIYKDGLDIHTTLDRSAQEHVEFLLSNSESNPITYPDEDFQAGLTVLDTKTGAIRAIGGGRNRENDGWNYAIDGDGRQPGSTFKPILSYGPAIENLKWSTYHQINDDGAYKIAGTDSTILNWDEVSHGWITARYALQRSYNIPAVKTLEEVGYGPAKEFANNLGIEFANDSVTITDAIGGTETGVTPLQLAGAYRAFGNEGIYNEPYAVTKIVYNDNRTEEFKTQPEAVMSDYTAYMVTDMLKSVLRSPGTGTEAAVSGLPVAGKTGTTNLTGKDGSPDSWFSGYTTNYTVAVWTGYDEHERTVTDTKLAQRLFKYTMSEISKDIDTPDFQRPSSVVEVTVEKGSNPAKLPSEYTPDSEKVTELFVKGTEPTKTSEKYDQLDPVSGLSATYNEENQLINVEWNYDEDDNKPVSFEVSAGTNGSVNKLTTTKEKELVIENVEQGTTYTVQVIVSSDQNSGNVSEAASVQVEIPEEEVEEEVPEEEENTEEQNGNGNGNNGNGNGNGENNGGGNTGDDGDQNDDTTEEEGDPAEGEEDENPETPGDLPLEEEPEPQPTSSIILNDQSEMYAIRKISA
ncbi:transglycosylase domain-containing protein [Aquibacillus rhizosphaerae]|uniref:PBP1A family penicillin-binding protein n=1 Tax=Aquibacillus rhizosphaerae TaxID=3051431 RepID=A0ABT7L4Q9_9BACI|nr:PBP1A family penicillin-binding protein [Aquibacillus sp. LR5S19]MDL4840838.1 PBP1A family penicillin-binding protein [Aquibacillus sp. LR5S19]